MVICKLEFLNEVTDLNNVRKLLLTAVTISALASFPTESQAHESSSHGGVSASHPISGAFLQGYNTGTATCKFTTVGAHHGFILQNANHAYNCNDDSCGNSAGVEFLVPNFSRLSSITFSLSKVTNGTINLYLLTGQTPIPTFSVTFAQLNGASIVVRPSQFSPAVQQGNIGSLFIDANTCQQATITDIRINGGSGTIIPTPSQSCPSEVICQPPN